MENRLSVRFTPGRMVKCAVRSRSCLGAYRGLQHAAYNPAVFRHVSLITLHRNAFSGLAPTYSL